MIEALWSIEFETSTGYIGAGVAMFETGRIYGGDSNYYYVGDYRLKDNLATASIVVTHYSGGLNNVFGPLKQVNLNLTGIVNRSSFTVSGVAAESSAHIVIRLTRRAELP